MSFTYKAVNVYIPSYIFPLLCVPAQIFFEDIYTRFKFPLFPTILNKFSFTYFKKMSITKIKNFLIIYYGVVCI